MVSPVEAAAKAVTNSQNGFWGVPLPAYDDGLLFAARLLRQWASQAAISSRRRSNKSPRW